MFKLRRNLFFSRKQMLKFYVYRLKIEAKIGSYFRFVLDRTSSTFNIFLSFFLYPKSTTYIKNTYSIYHMLLNEENQLQKGIYSTIPFRFKNQKTTKAKLCARHIVGAQYLLTMYVSIETDLKIYNPVFGEVTSGKRYAA